MVMSIRGRIGSQNANFASWGKEKYLSAKPFRFPCSFVQLRHSEGPLQNPFGQNAIRQSDAEDLQPYAEVHPLTQHPGIASTSRYEFLFTRSGDVTIGMNASVSN